MNVTVYTTGELDSASFRRTVKLCPFPIEGVQLLDTSPPPLWDWVEANNFIVYKRRKNKDKFGPFAVYAAYKSMIRQTSAVVYIGRPVTNLDWYVIQAIGKYNKKLWLKA